MLQLDLSDPSSIADKCLEAIALYGHIDILVNNAGVSSRGSVLDSSVEVDRRVMEVNFFGTIALTKGRILFLRAIVMGRRAGETHAPCIIGKVLECLLSNF